MARANDPVYELEFRLMGAREQEKIWTHVLQSLAAHFACEPHVSLAKTCVDPGLQHNAAMRSMIYVLTTPAGCKGYCGDEMRAKHLPPWIESTSIYHVIV